jgi:hypothetical protein
VSRDGESFSHLSYHVSGDWVVTCNTYDGKTPILGVDAGSGSLSITVKGRKADESAVGFARALAREAQKFATEMERLHAAQGGGDGKAVSDSAA